MSSATVKNADRHFEIRIIQKIYNTFPQKRELHETN